MSYMKVIYDHQVFSNQKYGGVSKYNYLLINAIKNLSSVSKLEVGVTGKFTKNYYLKNLKPEEKFYSVPNFFPNKLINKINSIFSIPYLKYGKFDVFHATYYDPYFFSMGISKPIVITIYDMIHEKFGESYNMSNKIINWKAKCANYSDKIFSISETTKKDIVKILGISEDKIEVIYPGKPFEEALVQNSKIITYQRKNKYILYVGQRQGYKNFFFFISASAKFLKTHDLKLLCAGSSEFTKEELNLISKLGLREKLIYTKIQSEKHLISLYKNAEFFVFPSLYEGFGLSLLEAMQCNCPILCSDSKIFREVADEAALYFNPKSKNSIINNLSSIFKDDALKKRMIKAGNRKIKKYSWEKSAIKAINLYKKIVAQ